MKNGFWIALLSGFTISLSCSQEPTDDPIPFVPFSPITINTNLPEYQSLRNLGFVYLDGGVRGILLHKSGSEYIAYERNCSFQPNDACATVEMHSSNLYILDPCCNSTFSLSSGDPAGGPAFRPLRKYETIASGSEVTITDLILN
jgi:nitrite reductase/ring-hydroxylating ferredoxin subunit